MVERGRVDNMTGKSFQYSLCRVVLMVRYSFPPVPGAGTLSVLALSSRFDGL